MGVIPSRAIYESIYVFIIFSPLTKTVSLWRRLPKKEKLNMQQIVICCSGDHVVLVNGVLLERKPAQLADSHGGSVENIPQSKLQQFGEYVFKALGDGLTNREEKFWEALVCYFAIKVKS